MIDVLSTGHDISEVVCRALAKGLGGNVKRVDDEDRGNPVAVYGILRGTGEIIKRRWHEGAPFYYCDLGYMGAGHYGGYYRLCRNDLHSDLRHDPDYSRLASLRWFPTEVDRLKNSPILLAEPSSYIGQFFGFDPSEWTRRASAEIRRYTSRPFIVTRKGDDGKEVLPKCWALVHMQTNLSVEAVRLGIPVFAFNLHHLNKHPSYSILGGGLDEIEDPEVYSRTQRCEWAAKLAATQFRLDEMHKAKEFFKL